MNGSSAQKELKVLVDAIEERGFTVEKDGGHQKIYMGGRVVQFEQTPGDPTSRRPITLPSTPSDPRWRDNTVSQLIRWRVLDADPFGAGREGLSDEDIERRAEEREKREQRQAEAETERQARSAEERDRQAEADEFRERVRSALEPVGAWKVGEKGKAGDGRSIGQAARIAYLLAEKQGDIPLPASLNAGQQGMRRIFEGGGVGETTRAFIEVLLDDLEAAPDPIMRYFELLREELGIEQGGPKREPTPEPEPEPEHGVEPLAVEAEDDERVRELRERLEEETRARREAEEALKAERSVVEVADRARADMEAELAKAQNEQNRLIEEALAEAQAAQANGNGNAKVPELAFEVLGEMIGQHVTVAGEDGTADLDAVLGMIDKKRERSVELAKQVAALELGVEVEA